MTRAWEFALGGFLALVIDAIALPRALRLVAGWAGVAGLVACGLVLQVGAVFPGYAAVWPILSAVLVIAAGASGSRAGVDRILSARPMQYLGNLSYALHLPSDRDAGAQLGHGGAQPVGRLPVRRAGHGSGTGRCLAAGQRPQGRLCHDRGGRTRPSRCPGAGPGFEYQGAPGASLAPSFVALPEDWAWIDNCVMSPRGAELQICSTVTDRAPERRIVIVGDSHPTQFIATLRPVAERRNWHIIVMSRGGCPFSTDSEIVPGEQACVDWNAAAVEKYSPSSPNAVFTTATRDVRVGLTEHTPPGFLAQWRKLDQTNIPVLAVRDNPRYDFAPSLCVETNGPDAPECATPRAELYAPEAPYQHLAEVPPNVSFLDFSDSYCTPDMCPPVIGNVLVYLDDNHVTATYLSTMADTVEQAIDSSLGWGGPEPPQPA